MKSLDQLKFIDLLDKHVGIRCVFIIFLCCHPPCGVSFHVLHKSKRVWLQAQQFEFQIHSTTLFQQVNGHLNDEYLSSHVLLKNTASTMK